MSFRRWPWRALFVLAQKEEKMRAERERERAAGAASVEGKSEERDAWLAGLFGFGAEIREEVSYRRWSSGCCWLAM